MIMKALLTMTFTDVTIPIVCARQQLINTESHDTIDDSMIPIAGDYSHTIGGALDPKWTRLKTSPSIADREKEGLRLEMNGGKYYKRKQKAIIEFICLRESTDVDRRRDEIPHLYEEEAEDKDSGEDPPNDDDDDDDDNKSGQVTDDGHGGKLKFIRWQEEEDANVLRLEWDTEHACEDASDSGDKSGSGHWGFFTWFIIM